MGEEIISYVIPVIVEDQVIGIVGMDISTSLLYDNVKNVQVYEKGYAFLMDNEGRFVYHPEMEDYPIMEEFDRGHAYLYKKSLLSAENQSVEPYRWGDKSIYGVGGDEFVILYPNAVKETVEKEIEALDKVIDELNKQNNRKALHLQMAIGMAEYDSETDKRYMDVFHRADSAMYENKKAKKEANM